jgi:serine/threonine protein kinase
MNSYKEKRFNLKSGLMVAIQMIEKIHKFHEHDFIHRDIKPENFLIGIGEKINEIYIIDFGLSKRWLEKGKHIKYTEKKGLVGTARYTSVNAHKGIE